MGTQKGLSERILVSNSSVEADPCKLVTERHLYDIPAEFGTEFEAATWNLKYL